LNLNDNPLKKSCPEYEIAQGYFLKIVNKTMDSLVHLNVSKIFFEDSRIFMQVIMLVRNSSRL